MFQKPPAKSSFLKFSLDIAGALLFFYESFPWFQDQTAPNYDCLPSRKDMKTQNMQTGIIGLNKLTTAVVAAALLTATAAQAAIIIVTDGSFTYGQNFDTMPTVNGTATWTDGSGTGDLNGWYADGERDVDSIYRSNGDTLQNGGVSRLGNIGIAGVNPIGDRALGFQPGNDQTVSMGAYFRNTSGGSLEGFSLGYTGEQWRVIGADSVLTSQVQYQIFSNGTANLAAGSGWTTINPLAFTSPITGGSNRGIDGNNSLTRVVFTPQNVSGLTWGDTQELVIRWTTTGNPFATQNRQMLGIDDVSFAVIPEPSAFLMLGLGGLLLLKRRRR